MKAVKIFVCRWMGRDLLLYGKSQCCIVVKRVTLGSEGLCCGSPLGETGPVTSLSGSITTGLLL